MRLFSIILLIALSFYTLPLSAISTQVEAETVSIMALDVCNSSDSGIGTDIDMPFICEYPCSHCAINSTVLYSAVNHTLGLFPILFLQDRPPEVYLQPLN